VKLGPIQTVLLLACMVIAACSANPGSFSNVPAPMLRDAAHSRATPIHHVVFVIQENRSFNNLFMGFPGAMTQNYGYDTDGNKIPLHAQDLATKWDIDHSSRAFFTACDGQGSLPGTECKMDGWNNELAGFGHPANFAYAYTPKSQIQPYWAMAKQYVIADQTYASNLDGSFIAHQYVVGAYADHAVDFPNAAWGCEGGAGDTIGQLTQQRTYGSKIPVCFTFPTIASEADKAGVTWRFYTGGVFDDGGLWSSYQADKKIYNGPDWKNDVINPPAQFLTDIANGELANITWITPTYTNSDHPGLNAGGGPAWVASLVNAIGTSPFWKSTAIFIIWDDWGGWFDPMLPPLADYDGFGFRIPLIVISPYAKQGYVTHVQYETSSVLRFMEDAFGLPHLAPSDKRANDPAADAFNYGRRPRKFQPFNGSKPSAYWIEQERRSLHRALPGSMIGND
jgi:phospholipase C